MCEFLSAIVTRDGRVLTDPATSDSHHDLIQIFGLRDINANTNHFVRVEFVPDTNQDVSDLSTWDFRLDESDAPSWWDNDCAARARSELERIVNKHMVTNNRRILGNGWYVVCGAARIDLAMNCSIEILHGSAWVGEMCDSAKVGKMYDSARVDAMCDSAKVGKMCDSARVDAMCDSAKVGKMCDSARVDAMCDSARVNAMCDSAKVGKMYDSAKVGKMYDSARVDAMYDSAKVVADYRE